MKTDIPKQFLLLNQKPVLMHTLEIFHNSDLKPYLILVLNKDFEDYWEKLKITYNFKIPHKVIHGGLNRFESVKNGLNEIEDDAVVAIHDAVRPLITKQLITESFTVAEAKGNAVCGVKCKDSLRKVNKHTSTALNREDVYLIQTPQTFISSQIKKAYEQAFDPEFTDDATVVEKSGVSINLIEGLQHNIKITYPEDILIAEFLLKIKNPA